MGFDWLRAGKGYGGEGALRRSEAALSIEQLAERSRPMAERIIDTGNVVDSVRRRLPEIIDGTDEARVDIGADIVRRHPHAIPDHVDDPKEIAALILEIAVLIREQDERTRRESH